MEINPDYSDVMELPQNFRRYQKRVFRICPGEGVFVGSWADEARSRSHSWTVHMVSPNEYQKIDLVLCIKNGISDQVTAYQGWLEE